jgi:hypothetical protein
MAESKKSQVVTGPLVALKGPDGRNSYLYRGAVVDGFNADDVKRLVELGLVGDAEGVVPGTGFDPSAR